MIIIKVPTIKGMVWYYDVWYMVDITDVQYVGMTSLITPIGHTKDMLRTRCQINFFLK